MPDLAAIGTTVVSAALRVLLLAVTAGGPGCTPNLGNAIVPSVIHTLDLDECNDSGRSAYDAKVRTSLADGGYFSEVPIPTAFSNVP